MVHVYANIKTVFGLFLIRYFTIAYFCVTWQILITEFNRTPSRDQDDYLSNSMINIYDRALNSLIFNGKIIAAWSTSIVYDICICHTCFVHALILSAGTLRNRNITPPTAQLKYNTQFASHELDWKKNIQPTVSCCLGYKIA